MTASVDSALKSACETARVVVACGTGGVGKTSVAAATGLVAARAGRRVVVLTIDPARRLADAMGIASSIGNDPVRVDVDASIAHGTLQLSVADNGIGRTPQAWSHGLGLGGVRKRVKQLGGEVRWLENQPRGIVCQVRIPGFAPL